MRELPILELPAKPLRATGLCSSPFPRKLRWHLRSTQAVSGYQSAGERRDHRPRLRFCDGRPELAIRQLVIKTGHRFFAKRCRYRRARVAPDQLSGLPRCSVNLATGHRARVPRTTLAEVVPAIDGQGQANPQRLNSEKHCSYRIRIMNTPHYRPRPDLKQAPHQPRERLAGFVPRQSAVDKCRASLAGTLGEISLRLSAGQYALQPSRHHRASNSRPPFGLRPNYEDVGTWLQANGTAKTPVEVKTWFG